MTVAKEVSNPQLIYQFVKKVFPLVKNDLGGWELRAKSSPDAILAQQAIDSITQKEFHCLGGSIYSIYPGADTEEAVKFIVAYQTISDYLDNLVDAVEVQDEQAFRQLHLAMTEALEANSPCSDYYAYYPYREDGGYLKALVQTCQKLIRDLPSYTLVKPMMVELAEFYAKLQVTKHLHPSIREEKMSIWINKVLPNYPGLTQWEFAAATGSTLGIFCLFAMAYNPDLQESEVENVKNAYFPWIEGLHILLDYFIDLEEDRETCQLNFVAYYPSVEQRQERLKTFITVSLQLAENLKYPNFHEAIIRGLLAMYLSDEKGMSKECATVTRELIRAGGTKVKLLYLLCRQLRRKDIL